MKKFREILNLLPASEELKKVTSALDAKAQKTANFILKVRKIGKYIAWAYFMVYWAVQQLMVIFGV